MRPIASRSRWLLWPSLMVGLTLIAYLPAMRDGFIWDDDDNVSNNPVLTAPDGLSRTWLDVGANPQYYPLTFTTFILERRLWGLDPVGYHVVNIVLHAGSAVLIGLVLGELGVPGGWLAAALFALHPVQVESVAWVTERKNTLSGFLALAALGAYLRAGLPGPVDGSERPGRLRPGWYGLSVGLFGLALLSKSVVAMLAVVLLILTWWRRPRLRPGDLYALTPFFVLGAASGLTSVWLEVRHVGAGGSEFSRGLLDRLLLAGRVVWFYADKLIAPVHLSFNYPRWTIDPRRPGDWLPVLGVLLIAVVLFLARRRLGKGPIVAVLGYLAMLFPVLGFLNVYPMRYSFVADHFQYHASVVFLAAMAAASVRLMPGLARRPRLAAIAALPVLVWLGSLTWSRCLVFRDPVQLWTDTLAKNPSSWLAHSRLGNELANWGRLNEAIAHYGRVIEMRPNDKSAYFELGTAYFKAHDLPGAIRVFEQGLDRPDDPADESFGRGFLENYLGKALLSLGDQDGAIAHFRKAVVASPFYAEAHANLGAALAARGRPSEAREHLRAALRLNPMAAGARVALDRLGPNGDPPAGPRRPR